MRTFIEDYLQNPAQAIADALASAPDYEIDENTIYSQIASPEFRLYEEIVLLQ